MCGCESNVGHGRGFSGAEWIMENLRNSQGKAIFVSLIEKCTSNGGLFFFCFPFQAKKKYSLEGSVGWHSRHAFAQWQDTGRQDEPPAKNLYLAAGQRPELKFIDSNRSYGTILFGVASPTSLDDFTYTSCPTVTVPQSIG